MTSSTCRLCSKRLFLIFLPTPGLIFVPSFEWAQTIYYITASVILSTYSILLNAPGIIHFLHGRPVYFEDLEDDMAADPRTKRRFQKAFEFSLTITLAILMGSLIDYYLDRYHNTILSGLELLGVFGGFLSLLSKCEDIIGQGLLFGLHCYKVEYSPRQPILDEPSIQMTSSRSALSAMQMTDFSLDNPKSVRILSLTESRRTQSPVYTMNILNSMQHSNSNSNEDMELDDDIV